MSRKLALLVGNGRYEASLPRLAKPDADIAALARVLADPAIGGFDEVTPLLDAPSAQVRLEIARFFAARGPDDLLLLYFSGHGLRSDRGAGGLYLAVRDTDPGLLSATAIAAEYVTGEMDYCRSRRQILILDCCYSGAFERGAKGPAASPGAAFEGNGLGRVVLTASDAQQLAWEESLAGGATETSVFTRHLIHGLESGEADQDGDGLIGVDELFKYVYRKVVEENPRQTPGRWTYREQGDIVLARSPRGLRRQGLPDDLRDALASPWAVVREGAVRELARLLHGNNTWLAETARLAVEQALEDDSRRVAAAAAEVLAAASPTAEAKHRAPAESRDAPSPAALKEHKPELWRGRASAARLWILLSLGLWLVAFAMFLISQMKKPTEVLHPVDKRTGTPTDRAVPPGSTCVPGEEQVFNGLPFVHLCAGTFTMGSAEDDPRADSDEKPAHRVTLSEFWLGKTELTNVQYRRFRTDHTGEADLPVTNVSWDEAKEACESFGARLPTEAEWEYAARAGSQAAWSFGDDVKLLGEYAWYSDNSDRELHPVHTKKPNNWHLHDMHGNALEWVSDWYGPYSGAPQIDPVGPAIGRHRVLRGGSFVNPTELLRSASRYLFEPASLRLDIGFRCARGSRRQP